MPSLSRTSGYRVGAGWPISLGGFFLLAVAAFFILDPKKLTCGDVGIVACVLAPGLLILWSAARRAVISDTKITFRTIFRSIAIRWDEVAHIRRSDAWLVIKDVYGRSYRLGPYPRSADDLVRDVRARRPHAISPVAAWSAEHEPLAERETLAGFRENDRLTARQAIGVTLLVTLLIFGSVAMGNLGDFAEPLITLGIAQPLAYVIAFCALVLLLGLGVFFVSWIFRTPRRPDTNRI